jgi:excisionase family DNA binding protein
MWGSLSILINVNIDQKIHSDDNGHSSYLSIGKIAIRAFFVGIVGKIGHNGCMNGEDFVSVDDGAKWLMLSAATVRRLIRTRKLSAVRVGERKWKIPKSALTEYLAQGASPALPKSPE